MKFAKKSYLYTTYKFNIKSFYHDWLQLSGTIKYTTKVNYSWKTISYLETFHLQQEKIAHKMYPNIEALTTVQVLRFQRCFPPTNVKLLRWAAAIKSPHDLSSIEAKDSERQHSFLEHLQDISLSYKSCQFTADLVPTQTT